MTLYGFCIQVGNEVYEACAWGLDVDDAFSVLPECLAFNNSLGLTETEWEYCALATFDNDVFLIWWLGQGVA